MYDNIIGRDYVQAQLDYRRDRIRGELAGRRRRSIIRRGSAGESRSGTVR
ncbi:hypothetical protein [Nocardioides sp. URHA0020]|nr:hypothetical protein [Nocardioides sp. URHA0020]